MTPLLATALILAAAIWLLGLKVVVITLAVILAVVITLMILVSSIGVLWIVGEGR